MKNIFAYTFVQTQKYVEVQLAAIKEVVSIDYGIGTKLWWEAKLKEFQFGDRLELDENNQLNYAAIDNTNRIISQASATTEVGGGIVFFVNKGTIGALEPLNNNEIGALKSYIELQLMVGSSYRIESKVYNLFALTAVVHISKDLFDSDGKSLKNGNYPVHEALRNFVGGAVYNQSIFIGDMNDYVRKNVSGMRNLQVNSVTIDNNADALADGIIQLPNAHGRIVADDEEIKTWITYVLV